MLFTTRNTDTRNPASIVGNRRRQSEITKAQQALIDALAAADQSQAVSALAELRLALREAHADAKRKAVAITDTEWQLLNETEEAVDVLGKHLLDTAASNNDYAEPQRAA